jgi:hypothetical protein
MIMLLFVIISIVNCVSLPQLISSFSFEPVTSSPDAIVDSVGDNDGVREGVNASTGLPLVRFLNASSAFCKEGSCVTFWALSSAATMQSTGRITLRSQLDFPSLGGAIAFWLYMETESPYNPRLVAKFLPDASQSLFQIGLLEISPRNVNGTAFNRTSSVDGGEEYNYFVFRCYFQYKSTSGALVPSAEFQFKTHPFKQQWQHIAVSFGASGVKLFRDFTLMETLPLSNFSSYVADTTLPVTVGNHPAMQRAPAARIDELRFFAFNTPDDDVTEQNLQSLAKPVAPPTSFSFPSGARSTTKFRPFTTTPKSTTNGAVTTGTGDAVTTVAISGGGSSGSSSNSTASTTTALNGFEPIADEPTALPNKGALIGGLIGGLLAVILLLSLLVCVLVREKRRRRHDDVPVVVSTQQPPVAAVDSTSTLSTPNIGMYDRVPPAPTPVAAKRNMYTAAPAFDACRTACQLRFDA